MHEVAGTVLTCEHSGCDCRVEIRTPCSCEHHGDAQYRCHCGAPLVAAG
ncbi:metallothionein [Sporichthya sp.]